MPTLIEKKVFSSGELCCFNDKPLQVDFYEVKQVHGDKVVDLDQHDCEADGIIQISRPFKPMAIKTADCLPIFYEGKDGIALIHAGWRGLHQKIHLNKNLIDLNPNAIHIGPCISVLNYEVTNDFLKNFPASKNIINRDGNYYFDLSTQALDEIKEVFSDATITKSNLCTFAHPQLNSYRENKTEKRNYNVFLPKNF